ncbi:MAG: chemotaxis protein CheA [Sedimentisphaerales bacterium]|nr:chemotaxis protein CheA [Sedimentisphaerales bacterium]
MDDNAAFDIDPELLAGFVDEALEGLVTLDSLFVKLEAEPSNLDAINAIFRPVHTVKGNSAFFGLMKVKGLAHEMETLLDLAKQEKLVPNQAIIDVLLEGVDCLREMLSRARDGQTEIENEEYFNELLQKVISAREAKEGVEDTVKLWNDLFEKLEKAKTDFANLDSIYVEQLNAIAAIIHLLRSDSPGSDDKSREGQPRTDSAIPKPLEEIKAILDKCGDEDGLSEVDDSVILKNLTELKNLTTDQKITDVLSGALDECHKIIDSGGGGESLLVELMQEKTETLLSFKEWKTASKPDEKQVDKPKKDSPAEKPKTAEKSKTADESRKTMRVTEDSIDKFLNYVGELIAVGEMYDHLQKMVSGSELDNNLATEFRRVNETFNDLSDNLQKSIMEVRKVSVKTLLQKIPRMVRDVASNSGKQVKVELVGEDIEIDKRLIETLDGPLTHMVRNAVDHGVETPDKRQAAGKPAEGNVCVAVTETPDDVTLTISDDGKGLDIEAIRNKAVKLGLVKPDQQLSQDQIIDMIFASGVSTAEKVTEISGRGVGMDVVKRSITDANGKIVIETEPGKGTRFIIKLPKTVSTQIITGFLVKLSGNRYVIPMDKVQEVFRPESQQVSSVTARGICVLRHGKLLPVVKLADVFNNFSTTSLFGNDLLKDLSSEERDIEGIMVAANARNTPIAIYVDDVIGVQKVVLKDLVGLEVNSQYYTAAAIMGDGSVAMVLDTDQLFETINAEKVGI